MKREIVSLQEGLRASGHYHGKIDGVFGPLTLSAQIEAHGAQAWMLIAAGELGVSEAVGSRDNPRIRAYHAATTMGEQPDAVPWCSSFANWVMLRAGQPATRSAAARSWERYGVRPVGVDTVGAIAVLSRGAPPSGHVGFLAHATPDRLYLLGGNQGDAVSVRPFPRASLLALRWPLQPIRK